MNINIYIYVFVNICRRSIYTYMYIYIHTHTNTAWFCPCLRNLNDAPNNPKEEVVQRGQIEIGQRVQHHMACSLFLQCKPQVWRGKQEQPKGGMSQAIRRVYFCGGPTSPIPASPPRPISSTNCGRQDAIPFNWDLKSNHGRAELGSNW